MRSDLVWIRSESRQRLCAEVSRKLERSVTSDHIGDESGDILFRIIQFLQVDSSLLHENSVHLRQVFYGYKYMYFLGVSIKTVMWLSRLLKC